MNAVAGEILDAAVDVDTGSRQDRLRAAAVANGILRAFEAERISASERARILESTRGLGPLAEEAIDFERDPR